MRSLPRCLNARRFRSETPEARRCLCFRASRSTLSTGPRRGHSCSPTCCRRAPPQGPRSRDRLEAQPGPRQGGSLAPVRHAVPQAASGAFFVRPQRAAQQRPSAEVGRRSAPCCSLALQRVSLRGPALPCFRRVSYNAVCSPAQTRPDQFWALDTSMNVGGQAVLATAIRSPAQSATAFVTSMSAIDSVTWVLRLRGFATARSAATASWRAIWAGA